MADRTGIEWTEATWNPTTGCDRVSSGCDNCYALALAKRLKAMGQVKYQLDGDTRTSGPGFGLTVHPDALEMPLRLRRPSRIFVNSMSDLFHVGVPDDFVAEVFGVMAAASWHIYQVLTKRPQRMASLLGDPEWPLRVWSTASGRGVVGLEQPEISLVLDNVWLGTTIEDDRYAFRADHLRATPASIRFLSLEPLLGPLPSLDLADIHWVIVGGESGTGARPMDLGWARELRDRCLDEGIPFFFKQHGGRTPKANGRELDGRTWDEMPSLASMS